MITIKFYLEGYQYPKTFHYQPEIMTAQAIWNDDGNIVSPSRIEPNIKTLENFLDFIDPFVHSDTNGNEWRDLKAEISLNVKKGDNYFEIGKNKKIAKHEDHTKNRVTIFEHLNSKQEIPQRLMPTSIEYLRKIQNQEIQVDGLFIYVEVQTRNDVTITGTMNDQELKFRKVFPVGFLYKAEISENIFHINNEVMLNVSFFDGEEKISRNEIYTFSGSL